MLQDIRQPASGLKQPQIAYSWRPLTYEQIIQELDKNNINPDIYTISYVIAQDGHSGQKTKNGIPYIKFQEQVVKKVETIYNQGSYRELFSGLQLIDIYALAILHDVIEDTPYTLKDIQSIGVYSDEFIDALSLLTHGNNTYAQYILDIRKNKMASIVKFADLLNNKETLPKLEGYVSEDTISRLRTKYENALALFY